jgi:hypoxanthine-DNA glycosylase
MIIMVRSVPPANSTPEAGAPGHPVQWAMPVDVRPPSPPPNEPVRKRCFDPVVDANTRLLVLGSLPGDKSLAAQQYYGNRQNRFWNLMSEVIGTPLVPLDYENRLATLLRHGVGLWDVVAEAHRTGSLDSQIRAREENDLLGLLTAYPQIRTIAFNGGTAARFGIKKLGERASIYRIVCLPSSSPAYTLPYAEKLAQWNSLSEALGDD